MSQNILYPCHRSDPVRQKLVCVWGEGERGGGRDGGRAGGGEEKVLQWTGSDCLNVMRIVLLGDQCVRVCVCVCAIGGSYQKGLIPACSQNSPRTV